VTPGSLIPKAIAQPALIPAQVRAVLANPPEVVAPRLLGWVISHTTAEGQVAVELTEVEAYAGQSDPASHAWRGRTARNSVMFGPPGYLYVYLSHGVHACANVVTGPDGTAAAVLLRAGRVVAGLELARQRRGAKVADVALARGPGNLGQALGLSPAMSGTDLLGQAVLGLHPSVGSQLGHISRGPRVGVSRAADRSWRFWIGGDPTVSNYRRSKLSAK
jgi:DNA-3-methyladenine glycosylase